MPNNTDTFNDFEEFNGLVEDTDKKSEHPFGMEIADFDIDFESNSYESTPSFEDIDVRDLPNQTAVLDDFETYTSAERYTKDGLDTEEKNGEENNQTGINSGEDYQVENKQVETPDDDFITGLMSVMGLVGVYYLVDIIYKVVEVYL